ncbi:fluoride efflux transporter CrcB [Cellvibrio japonicus]|uniref:Fluoride-specific ion channel FluC n=1 Tax=Cellvibrio japonicus (strain Ueda107) TaxID=498211 RepID=B3PL39_CELJU|nr:fluoride efflux transporter CrcB [Cellvibrio japonicus]ACE85424.1 crcB protein [Cellvibrio japonicus Ueda107]QEI14219.1 fluoride efflux transporter CrcB [Cellvibrio japonicus]QEI17796.1 fluoride efflux transporter CrcB [Cellvibrio japonicus]QEI21371.1 fluoride efflux transporter CrcB [Cellvibrio japonicus]
MQWLAIAIGGALGSVLRFAAVSYLTPLFNNKFPLGTFVVNLLGSCLIGVAYVILVEKAFLPEAWRLFFITGVLGGFTTFSAFSLEILQLWQSGHGLNALFYAGSSVVLGLLMAFVGMALTQKFF